MLLLSLASPDFEKEESKRQAEAPVRIEIKCDTGLAWGKIKKRIPVFNKYFYNHYLESERNQE